MAANPFQSESVDYSQWSDSELSNALIAALYQYFEKNDQDHACRRYSPNHYLTREGEPNEFLWFVASGEVILEKQDTSGIPQEVMREKQGALIGVMSFVTRETAFVTSYTTTPVEVIKLDRNTLDHILNTKSELPPMFTHFLLRHFNRRLKMSIATELKLQQTLHELEVTHGRLIDSEKMAILGQLVAGVAHELNNPVTAILRGTENLSKNIPRIIHTDFLSEVKQLGEQVLKQSFASAPRPTTEIRTRTEEALKLVKTRNTAKKLVQLNLDDPQQFDRYFGQLQGSIEKTVEQLDWFRQCGTFLRNIQVCGNRIAAIVKGLKNYARPKMGDMEWVNVHDSIEDTLVMFENSLKHYQVSKQYAQLPPLQCFPNELQQIWTNFISNAIDATDGKGHLQIVTRLSEDVVGKPCLAVSIEDNGKGIAEHLQKKIFELNYTTKTEGHFGLGIGLAICAQITKRHNGHIAVESELGKFTRLTLHLPLNNELP